MDLVDHCVGAVRMILQQPLRLLAVARIARDMLRNRQVGEHAQRFQSAFLPPGRIVIQ